MIDGEIEFTSAMLVATETLPTEVETEFRFAVSSVWAQTDEGRKIAHEHVTAENFILNDESP